MQLKRLTENVPLGFHIPKIKNRNIFSYMIYIVFKEKVYQIIRENRWLIESSMWQMKRHKASQFPL